MARARTPARLGGEHLTGGHGNVPDDVVAGTVPGMADWVGDRTDRHCGDCIFHDQSSRSKVKRRCLLFRRLTQHDGPAIPSTQRACQRFEAAPVPPPLPPRTPRQKFLDPESWRRSARTPGNVLRSVLGTSLSVVVFQRHGLWSWVVHDDDGAPPIFSLHFHESRELAMIDCWERLISDVVDAGDCHD